MKIKKFNEDIDYYAGDIKKIIDDYQNLREDLRSYINWKKDIPEDDDSYPETIDFNLGKLAVEYTDMNGNDDWIDIDIEEFIKFSNNPDLYNSAKKYNL